jgi:hypothetical protein
MAAMAIVTRSSINVKPSEARALTDKLKRSHATRGPHKRLFADVSFIFMFLVFLVGLLVGIHYIFNNETVNR